MTTPPRYRPEIDGLRALAVVLVLVYHADLGFFRGGFVGVDIFFVISGFLITQIINREILEGNFSYSGFYARRARRILPALGAMLVATLSAGLVLASPHELVRLAHSALAAIFFIPNIYFYRTTGYFNTNTETTPLLHTWSLGVEEQFYLFFPPVLLVLVKRQRRLTVLSLIIVASASLAGAEWAASSRWTMAGFFLLPFRAWELGAGALAALTFIRLQAWLTNERLRGVAAWLGVLLIAASVVILTPSSRFPGFSAVPAVAGTVLVLTYGSHQTRVGQMLATKPVVIVGLISYSVYLWHQPIFAFTRVVTGPEPNLMLKCGLLGATILVGALSWRFVERPFRVQHGMRPFLLRLMISLGASIFAGMTAGIIGFDGFARRFDTTTAQRMASADHEIAGRYVTSRFNSLLINKNPFGEDGAARVLVVGDSFAQDLINCIIEGNLFRGYDIRTIYIPAVCQLHLGIGDPREFIEPRFWGTCDSAESLESARRSIYLADVILFAAAWEPWAAEHFGATLSNLRLRENQQVIVFGAKGFERPTNLAGAIRWTTEPQHAVQRPKLGGNAKMSNDILRQILPPAIFVDPQELLEAWAAAQAADTQHNVSEELFSHDGSHLTREGAVLLGGLLRLSPPLQPYIEPAQGAH